MKPMNKMNMQELSDWAKSKAHNSTLSHEQLLEMSERLRELHDLTRWIPVSERLPTYEDGEVFLGKVLWMSVDGYVEANNYAQNPVWAVWWKRIIPPEGV